MEARVKAWQKEEQCNAWQNNLHSVLAVAFYRNLAQYSQMSVSYNSSYYIKIIFRLTQISIKPLNIKQNLPKSVWPCCLVKHVLVALADLGCYDSGISGFDFDSQMNCFGYFC